METKLSKLKKMMAAGDQRGALKLAAGWGMRGLGNGAHAAAITRGWAAITNKGTYEAMGYDPSQLFAAAIAAIKEKYNIP